MALKICPECGKEISSFSEVCVHCGYKEQPQRKKPVIIAFVIQLLVICMLLAVPGVYMLTSVYSVEYYQFDTLTTEYEESSANLYNFLIQEDNTEIDQSTTFFAYLTIVVMCISAVMILTVKSNSQHKQLGWTLPLLSACLLVVHGLMISSSKYKMLEMDKFAYERVYRSVEFWLQYNPWLKVEGSYEASPAPLWILLVVLEIVVCILVFNATKSKQQPQAKTAVEGNDNIEGYVDIHGNYYGP